MLTSSPGRRRRQSKVARLEESSSMTLSLFHVDAFTDRPLSGNPAAVCLLPSWKEDRWLQAVGREMNLSETAFLVQNADGFDLRWFTPEAEVDLCGQAMGLRLLFQWRHGGFHRELLKQNARTASVSFEYLGGGIGTAGGVRGKVSTRRLFPQVTADLTKRWCSPSLKIDVASIAINNEPCFRGKRILFLSGERRQESAARSQYAEMERHRTHTKSR